MYENVSLISYNDEIIKSFKTVEIIKIHVIDITKKKLTGKRNKFNRFFKRRKFNYDIRKRRSSMCFRHRKKRDNKATIQQDIRL